MEWSGRASFISFAIWKTGLNTKVNVENKLPSNLKGESWWWSHQAWSFSFQKWRIVPRTLCSLHVLQCSKIGTGLLTTTCVLMHAMLSWPSDVDWLLPSVIRRCKAQRWKSKCYLLWCMISIFQNNACCIAVFFQYLVRAHGGKRRW